MTPAARRLASSNGFGSWSSLSASITDCLLVSWKGRMSLSTYLLSLNSSFLDRGGRNAARGSTEPGQLSSFISLGRTKSRTCIRGVGVCQALWRCGLYSKAVRSDGVGAQGAEEAVDVWGIKQFANQPSQFWGEPSLVRAELPFHMQFVSIQALCASEHGRLYR